MKLQLYSISFMKLEEQASDKFAKPVSAVLKLL